MPSALRTATRCHNRKTKQTQYRYEAAVSWSLRNAGVPHEIARMAAFLGSEDADYVHGSAVVMDGGWLTAAREPY